MGTVRQERELAMSGMNSAFDIWLKQQLKQLYAEVLDEPVPVELVALILR